MNKVWKVKPGGRRLFSSAEHVKSTLLRQRGIRDDMEAGFLEPRYSTGIHDPYLLADMREAVDRIYKAIEKKEHVLVYGDYDVDGVSGTAVMVSVLRLIGATVVPFIPHRSDHGYGLDTKVLQELINDFELLITVDCGINNQREIEWLRSKRRDTIVVDHHVLPKILPSARAVLHPDHPDGRYPFKHLCGVAMSWKLAAGLLRDKRCCLEEAEEIIREMIGLVCLGTIADMMPLVGENRVIVRYGLKELVKSKRSGVRALVQSLGAGVKVDVDSVSYRLGPLLNAAGRIDHAQPALDLLLESDEGLAVGYLGRLKELNNERRKIGQLIQSEAERVSGDGSGPLVFAANTRWQAGVVGLVAGRLCERFGKPAVVIGGANGKAVGSTRVPKGVSALGMLEAGRSHLTKFGGHERAAGFTLEESEINNLRQALIKNASKWRMVLGGPEIEQADLVMNQELVNWELAEVLRQMEPFGQGNEQPRFVFESVYLGDWRKVGKTGEHVKMAFNMNDDLVDGIGFGLAGKIERSGIQPKEVVDVLGGLEVNEYNGRRMLQVRVIDVERAGGVSIIED
jgi:single-stranded-DNA-specific exonuclease